MDQYIITVYNGKQEIPMTGVPKGETVDLSNCECRCIYPEDWKIFKQYFSEKIFNPEITDFLNMNFEIRIYKIAPCKKAQKKA